MKEMKRIISAVMAVVLCLNLCFSTAWAENLNTAVKTTLDVSTLEVKDVDQTVALTIEMEKDIVIDGFGGQLYWPQEIKLTSISNEELGLTGGDYNLANGKFGWSSPDAENQNFKYIITAVFTVPANTTAGTYEIGVKDLEITCDYGTPYDDAKALAASSTLTISGGVTPPAHTCTLTKVPAKAATCTEDGNIEYYQCSDTTCGKLYKDAAGTQEITKADTVIKAGHTDLKLYPAKDPTCDSDGHVAYWFCTGCDNYYFDNNGAVGEKTTGEKVAIPATGHKWVLVVGGYEEGAPNHTIRCSVCGQKKDEAHADRPGDVSNKWESDKDNHWNVYGCGTIMNKAAHTWGEGVVTTPATCTKAGVKTYTCDVCKATKTEPIPVIAHQYEWKHDETNHWQECSVCHDIIDKAEHTYASHKCEDTAACTKAECGYVKPAGQHSWNDGEVTTPATCTTDGVKTYTCKVCSETKTEPIKASGHSLTKVEAVAATCTEGGNNEYYTCSVCKKVFKADATTETTVADETLAALGHKLTKTEAKAATCTEVGNKEYYTCDNCGKFFSDADGKNEIAKDSWVIDALKHDFTGAWVNTDAAGHYHKCSRCDATDTVVKHTFNGKPCTEEDSCKVCGYVKLAGQHTWGEKTYTWNESFKCTAATKCDSCNEPLTETVDGVKTTVPATCVADGKDTYTATFTNAAFTTQTKEVTIDKLGHTYGAPVWSWSEDGKTATATFTCTREGCTAETTGHAQTVTATVSGKQNVAPTCTDKGTTTYTAKVTFETKDYTDTKDVQDIKALGHKLTKTAAKAAACTEAGNSEYYTCGTCGKFFSDKDGKNEIAKDSWVIKALGHKLTQTPAVTPTCEAGGNNEYWTCSVCHKVFKADKTTETTVAKEILAKDPTNHTGGTELRGAVAASCMTAGRTDDTYCKGCSKLTKAGDLIPPTGVHNYKDGVCTTCGNKQPANGDTIKAAIEDFISDVVDAAEVLKDKIEKSPEGSAAKKILEKLQGYVSGSSRSKLQAVYNVTMNRNNADLKDGETLVDGQNVTIAISEETYNALRSGAKIVESYLVDDKGEAQTREINATLNKTADGGYTVTFTSDKTAVYGLMTRTSSGSSSGSGSSYTSGQSFTTDLPADSINRVTVNGKKLDSKYYTVSSNGSGSIVTLTDAYLATLKAGKYTVKIENKTHVSTGTFTIKADGTLSSPKTADAGIALYAVMAVSSLMGTAVVSKKRRKA